MRQSTQNTHRQNSSIAAKLLYSVLTSFEKEQILTAFDDMDKMFKEYLYTRFADNYEQRQQFTFSLEIIQEFGSVVTHIPKELVKKLEQEVNDKLKPVN